jgi:ABC-2 type transport system ATP-binding protein
LRVLPKDGCSIAGEVTQIIHEKAIAIEEIYIERGKLDDVFRLITTSETGAGDA